MRGSPMQRNFKDWFKDTKLSRDLNEAKDILQENLNTIGDKIRTHVKPQDNSWKENANPGESKYQYNVRAKSSNYKPKVLIDDIKTTSSEDNSYNTNVVVLGDESDNITSDATSDATTNVTSGDLSKMPYFSLQRIEEYKNRNWAMDHTTDASIIKPVKVPPEKTNTDKVGTLNNPHDYYPGADGVPGQYYTNPRTGQTMRFIPGHKKKPFSYEYMN